MTLLRSSACPLHPALWVLVTLLLVFVSSALTYTVTVAATHPAKSPFVICPIPVKTIEETDNG